MNQRLRTAGTQKPDVERLLEPVRALEGDYDFWQHQSGGLAVFRSHSVFQLLRVALRVPELGVVASQLLTKSTYHEYDRRSSRAKDRRTGDGSH